MSINKVFLLSMIAMLSACSSDVFITHTGNMPSEEKISMVFNGQTKNDVLEVLGSPSNVVSLDKDTWIYMSSEIKQVAFFAPKEVNRELLVIKFDTENRVASIEKLNKKHGEKVEITEEQTPNQEQEQGFFRKYFGGVGQYLPFGNGGDSGLE